MVGLASSQVLSQDVTPAPSIPRAARGQPEGSHGLEQEQVQVPGQTKTDSQIGPQIDPQIDPLVNSIDPDTYRLRPGDQMMVEFSGLNQLRLSTVVDQFGGVTIAPAAPIRIGGLTLRSAVHRLQKGLSLYYKDLHIRLRVTALRRFQIEVSGEVKHPGLYITNGLKGVYELIQDAGGFTPLASRRRVLIVDSISGKLIRAVDVARFEYLGDHRENPSLFPNQRLLVRASAQRVEVGGQVGRPGKYEIVEGENLATFLQMAGGLTSRADLHNIAIGRLEESGSRRAIQVDGVGPNASAFTLQEGDLIEVYDRSLHQSRVEVVGELNGAGVIEASSIRSVEGLGSLKTAREGAYYIREGETVRELVLELGGPTATADLEYAWVERKQPQTGVLSYLPVNLRKLLHNDSIRPASDFALQNGDRLVVPPQADSVFVIGYVFHPGQLPYIPGYGIREYLAQSGGPTREASTNQGRIIRRIPGEQPVVFKVDYLKILNGKAGNAFDVRAGDVLFIPHYQPFYQDTVNILSSILPLFFYLKN